MAISPILFNGTVSRMQDVSAMKHNEDAKGMVDQSNFQTAFHKEIDTRLSQVNQSDAAENRQKKFDAKDEGENSYGGDGGQHRKKEKKPQDGQVFVKKQGGFDIKI